MKNLFFFFFLDASKHKKEDGQVQSSEVSFVRFQQDNLVTGFELMKCSKVNTLYTASWECHSMSMRVSMKTAYMFRVCSCGTFLLCIYLCENAVTCVVLVEL